MESYQGKKYCRKHVSLKSNGFTVSSEVTKFQENGQLSSISVFDLGGFAGSVVDVFCHFTTITINYEILLNLCIFHDRYLKFK